MSIQNNNSTFFEKFLDYAIPFQTYVKEGVILGALGYFGYYSRALMTGGKFLNAFWDLTHSAERLLNETPAREITPTAIANGFYNETISDISAEKLQYAVARTQQIARQMGISQKVSLFSSEEVHRSSSTSSCRIGFSKISLFLGVDDLRGSQASLDFVIAHELSHYVHSDKFRDFLFSAALLTMDLFAAYFFGPYAIPLVEGILASPLENKFQQRKERQADLNALRILNSSEGLLAFVAAGKAHNQAVRQRSQHTMNTSPRKYFAFSARFWGIRKIVHLFSKRTLVSTASPSYDNRADLRHPSLSERHQYGLTFQPQ